MAGNITTYGDISPRTAVYAMKRLLKRAIPYLVLEKFGQARPLPRNHSMDVKFRRYERFPFTPTPLTEGVTPSARKLQTTDYPCTLQQYGDRIEISDVVMDTHEDPVMRESIDILAEQAAQMLETVRYYVVRAGTNVFYSNGASRSEVNTPLTLALQRQIMRALKRQDARKVTKVIRSTSDYGTQNVAPAYIALCHPDVENDIREMKGFVPTEQYGNLPQYDNEIGKCEDFRYLSSTVFVPFDGEGGASSDTVLSVDGSKADVYPVLYIAADSYGIVPLKGPGAVTPMVVNPKPSDSDPLAQRGHVGWKAYQTACILNDAWLVRAEVAVSA